MPRRTSPVAPAKGHYLIYLQDQAPRIGCGWRRMQVTSVGRKWVHMRYAVRDDVGTEFARIRFRMALADWQGLAASRNPPVPVPAPARRRRRA